MPYPTCCITSSFIIYVNNIYSHQRVGCVCVLISQLCLLAGKLEHLWFGCAAAIKGVIEEPPVIELNILAYSERNCN